MESNKNLDCDTPKHISDRHFHDGIYLFEKGLQSEESIDLIFPVVTAAPIQYTVVHILGIKSEASERRNNIRTATSIIATRTAHLMVFGQILSKLHGMFENQQQPSCRRSLMLMCTHTIARPPTLQHPPRGTAYLVEGELGSIAILVNL